MKVLSVERNEVFEFISVKLLLPSGHHMLVVGVYHPPSFKYSECDLIDCIIELTDEFSDCFPDGVILRGGDLNQLDFYSLATLSGLVKLVDFLTRGGAVLDNCLTNKPELFQTPFPYQALIKTDHVGVILPPGNKLRPVRRKYSFRDFRELRKIKFESMIQTCDWTAVLNAQGIDGPNQYTE